MAIKYYCNTCQTLNEYENGTLYCATNNTINAITQCATNNEFITDTLPNQMKATLIQFNKFGDHDSNENQTNFKRIPIVSSLNNQNNYDIITFVEYKKLVDTINASPAASEAGATIGSYYQNLKEDINNYLIPSTRYYDSCDYATQCCDSHCDHCCRQICEGGDCTSCYGSCNTCDVCDYEQHCVSGEH